MSTETAARPSQEERFRLLPPDYLHPLRMEDHFERSAPLQVDIGCGDGSFLVALAARHPQHNVLGIERLYGRVANACRRIQRAALRNARVLRLESHYAVRYLVPRDSVAICHILFPDPWPKRRHHRRRLIQPSFLDAAHSIVVPGGEVRFKTDDASYFDHARTVAEALTGFRMADWPAERDEPLTNFERHYVLQNRPIYRLRLVKVCSVMNELTVSPSSCNATATAPQSLCRNT